MSHLLPFNLCLDDVPIYNHDMFPNRMYRRLHARHHDPLGFHGLGMIARLGAHAHGLMEKRLNGCDMAVLHSSMDKRDMQLHLDVGLFQPDELSVKVIDDHVIVEGKHEEREDEHGCVSRHFKRRYMLPKGYDADKIESTLTTDGVLTVKMPKKMLADGKDNERIIQIKEVGPSDLFIRNNNADSSDSKPDTNEKEK